MGTGDDPAFRVRTAIGRILPQVTDLRHELHAHPETALEETETRNRLRKFLGDGFTIREPLLGTDLIAELPASPAVSPTAGGWIALRADMDGLALDEDTGAPWASRYPGRMHACGHDGHMAILAGAARVLAALAASGTVLPHPIRFVFQPGEEAVGAGRELAARGAYDGALTAYALHGWPGVPAGSVALKRGVYFGASHHFRAVFRGRGGHGAYPERSLNPLPAAAAALLGLKALHDEVSGAGPEVVTPCSLAGGHAANVIPDSAVLLGTVRFLESRRGDVLEQRVRDILGAAAAADGVGLELVYDRAYDVPVVNDGAACDAVRRAAALCSPPVPVVEEDLVERGSEDFAYALARVPGCLFKLGTGIDAPPLHSSRYDFPDGVIPAGIAMMVGLALDGVPR